MRLQIIRSTQKLNGWVYEGYIDTITDVLNEVDGLLEDFYIVTPQFDKLAAYTDDGQCLCIYEKQ